MFEKLDEYGFTYLNNIDTSGIVWIPLTELQIEGKRDVLEELLKQQGLEYSYERRGAIATKGKPAYLIRVGKDV